MLKHKSDMPARSLVAERIVAVAKNRNLGRERSWALFQGAAAYPQAADPLRQGRCEDPGNVKGQLASNFWREGPPWYADAS